MSHSSRIASTVGFVLVWTASQGCSTEILNPNCPDAGSSLGGPAVVVRLMDSAGNPAALGTTVRLEGSGPDQTAIGRDPSASVIEIGNRPGKFDVVITRPWWVSPRAREIRVPTPENFCDGFQTTQIFATLTLRPDAPAIRQIVPEHGHLSVNSDPPFAGRNARGRYGRTQLRAYVEGDPTVATAIEWIATQPEIADVTPDGVMTVTCRESPIDTSIIVRSQTDPGISASVRVTVERTSLFVCP